MFILENRWGNDGYAAWFKILEMLGLAENHFIDCHDTETWEYLVAKLKITPVMANEILDTLSNLKAIDSELWETFRVIYSSNFVDGVAPAYRFRKDKIVTREFVVNRVSHVGNSVNHSIAGGKPNKPADSIIVIPTEEMRRDMRGGENPAPLSCPKIGAGETMDISEINQLYITYVGKTPHRTGISNTLAEICQTYRPEQIRTAFKAVVNANSPNINWIRSYLDNPNNWAEKKYKKQTEEAISINIREAMAFCGMEATYDGKRPPSFYCDDELACAKVPGKPGPKDPAAE